MLKQFFARFKKKPKKDIKFKAVVSYTTRPKRTYETDGVEHYFLDDEKATKILADEPICAYTEIGPYVYFVTKEEIQKPENNLYIIDPDGIKYLFNRWKYIRSFMIIYIDTDKYTRDERAKNRPGYNEEIYKNRVESEDVQFSKFEVNILSRYHRNIVEHRMYDDIRICRIFNEGSLKRSLKKVRKFIEDTYDSNVMYLVVGRTCSGKDTICNKLIKGELE